MLPKIAETGDRATSAAETEFPNRAEAVTARFRAQCLRRLNAEPNEQPRPIRRADQLRDKDLDDPAVSAIDEWRDARNSYLARRREVEPLWNAVPDWVRNWHGVYAGRAECADGTTVPILVRTETALNDCYDRRVRDAKCHDEVRRIETRRRKALAELRLTLAAEKGAYRAAGLPFDREIEDDFWHDYRDRIARAKTAVETIPAESARGIEARCRHAARLIEDLEVGGADCQVARHVCTVILRIANDVAEFSEG